MAKEKKAKEKKSQALMLPSQGTIEQGVEEAQEEARSLRALSGRIGSLVVRDPEVYENVLEVGRKVREAERRIEDKQKSLTGLCDMLKRQIVGLFRPFREQVKEVLETVDAKRQDYEEFLREACEKEQERLRLETEKEQKRLQRKAERLASKTESRAEAKEILAGVPRLEIPEAPEAEPPKVDGVTVARIWDFEILDEEAVPQRIDVSGHEGFGKRFGSLVLWRRNFCRAELLTCREAGIEVLGVRFFQKDSVRYEKL